MGAGEHMGADSLICKPRAFSRSMSGSMPGPRSRDLNACEVRDWGPGVLSRGIRRDSKP